MAESQLRRDLKPLAVVSLGRRPAAGSLWCGTARRRAARAKRPASTAPSGIASRACRTFRGNGFSTCSISHRFIRLAAPSGTTAASAAPAVQDNPGKHLRDRLDRGGHDAVHPQLVRLRIFAASYRPASSSSLRSRSTSPCNVRPTIRGCSSIRNGSSAGPTARCATPKIRPRSMRTSSIRISSSQDRRRLVECLARRGAVLDRAGSAHFPGRQPPHQALPILGVADP